VLETLESSLPFVVPALMGLAALFLAAPVDRWWERFSDWLEGRRGPPAGPEGPRDVAG